MPASDYINKARLNWRRGTTYPSAPATTYFALMTGNPDGTDAGGTEMTGTGYARVAVTADTSHWNALTQPGGAGTAWESANTNAISWGNAASDWVTPITAVAEYDASSSGHLLSYKILSVSLAISAGQLVEIPAGDYLIEDL